MGVQIRPTEKQIACWIQKYIPEKDLFFLRQQDLAVFIDDLQGTLIFPREEFFKHSSYNGIHWVNSYMYWKISKEAQVVVVAHPVWIQSIPKAKRDRLFRIQYELGRGLTGDLSFLPTTESFPKEYIVEVNGEKCCIIQREMWLNLPIKMKEEIMVTSAQLYDQWIARACPPNMPVHLMKYANTFSTEPGANCLGATLFAISANPVADEWIVHEWVHGRTFALGLEQASFEPIEDKFRKGDVIVWRDNENNIQHASYCLSEELFFNKNGQTFFNPWKIVEWTELEKEWERFNPQVYRKTSGIEVT